MAFYDTFKKIDADAIVDGSIATVDIGDNQITAVKLATNAVTEEKISNEAVTATELAGSLDISGKSVTYRPIVTADINASAAIDGAKLASGAAVANLGYTPLSRAGGTMQGQLLVPAGNIAAPAIVSSQDTNTGVAFSGNDTIIISQGIESLRVNNSGHVTRPATPMFRTTGTSGWQYNNSYGGTGWRALNGNFGWAVDQRGGTNFDTGNGAFTAPVTGFYQFMFETFAGNDTNNTDNYMHLSFGRNGGPGMDVATGRYPHGIFGHGTWSFYVDGMRADLGMYMNAGQFVQVYVFWAGNSSRFHGAHSAFHGYLIA
jgi:hypothetical protein